MTPSFFDALPLGWSIYMVIVWLAVVLLVAINALIVLPRLIHASWAWLHDALHSSSPAASDRLGPGAASASVLDAGARAGTASRVRRQR